MKYSLNNIAESFMNRIRKKHDETNAEIERPLDKVRDSEKADISHFNFACPELEKYMKDLVNGGRDFNYFEAAKLKFQIDEYFFVRFEYKSKIDHPYTFNEMQYFKSVVPKFNDDYLENYHWKGKNSKFLKEITFPENWKEIVPEVFSGGKMLSKIILPPRLEKLGDAAFTDSKKLTKITIPETVKVIGARCFSGCTKLKKIYVPDSVTEIGSAAFTSCKHLKEIRLSKNLTEIKEYCFCQTDLEEITIPPLVAGVTAAFPNCTLLKKIILQGKTVFYGAKNFSLSAIVSGGQIQEKIDFYVPEKYRDFYSNLDNWLKDSQPGEPLYGFDKGDVKGVVKNLFYY